MRKLKYIFRRNTFHARIFISLLYFEKKYRFKLPFKILRKLIIQGLYCSEVHPESFISLDAITSLRLPHPYMIIIHRSTKIGLNCTIFQECTIGVIEEKTLQASSIGNNVYIGCKSTILGPIGIGHSVKIGACSLILRDIRNSVTKIGLWK